MITVLLQGGLGNQMLQYAFALSTAKRLGTELVLSTSRLQNDKIRQYNLSLFQGVSERVIEDWRKPTVYEGSLPYNPDIVRNMKDGDVILGYWPTEKYFEDIREEIAKRFQPKQSLPAKALEGLAKIEAAGANSTMLTIRRTDYVQKQDFHGVLPMSYYRDAIQYLRSHGVEPKIFVFSDEPEWCKANLDIGVPFDVVGTYDMTTHTHLGREDADLYMMGKCQHAITANSSFSWWGTWLTELERPNGIIIAPKQWFTTNTLDWRDIVPERWIKL